MSFLDSFANTYDELAGPELLALGLGTGLLTGGYTFASRHSPVTDHNQAVMPVLTPNNIQKYMASLDREDGEGVPKEIQESAEEALKRIEDGEKPSLDKAASTGEKILKYLGDPNMVGTVMGIAAATGGIPLGLYGGKEVAEGLMSNEQQKELEQARKDFNKAMLEEQLASMEAREPGSMRPVKSGSEDDEHGWGDAIKSMPGILVLGSMLAGGIGGYAYQSQDSSASKRFREMKRLIGNRMANRSQRAHEALPGEMPEYNRKAIEDFARYMKDKDKSRA